MENLIIGRAVLFAVVYLHALIGYSSRAIPWHINGKVLNTVMCAELVALTAFIIYDNKYNPSYTNSSWAMIGYIFVYLMVLGTYMLFNTHTLLDKDKVYTMTVTAVGTLYEENYFYGFVLKNSREINVWLPQTEIDSQTVKQQKTVNVKFKKVVLGQHIIVTLA